MATEVAVKPKKRNDAYTGLLALSFLAFVGGTVFLYLDLEQYKEGDKLKQAPDPIKIDVPGAQLKVIQGSGTPPPPKVEPMEPMMPEMPPMMMMRAEPKKDTLPVLLPPLDAEVSAPVEPVVVIPVIQPVQATEPTIRIPDLQLPPPPLPIEAPMSVKTQTMPPTQTVAPAVEPSVNDEPPLPPKRFIPPM